MKKRLATSGMNMREAVALARERRVPLKHRRGTGDLTVIDPRTGRSLQLHATRKDAPRVLTNLLRRCDAR